MRIFQTLPTAIACLGTCVSPCIAARQFAQARGPGRAHCAGLERVRDNPLALRDFLKRMPKGADLHNHLHSAVYAETLH